MKNLNSVNRVMQSYGRCCASQSFFDTFYQHFLASSPAIREKLLNADSTTQKHLLRAGILNLVLYARGMSDTKLRALGQSHSRAGFDIRPELYDLWVDSLLLTVRQHDPQVDVEDLAAWHEVLGKGINVIKSYY